METYYRVILSLILYTLLACLSGVSCANTTSACPQLYTPFYGVLVYNESWLSNDQPEWQENATVTLQCDRGYELGGGGGGSLGRSLELTCEGNDTWSDVPEQYSCLRVNCGQPPSVSNATVSLSSPNATDFGSTATYTCDQGYTLNGAALIVCQWQGSWTPQPTCTAIIDCGDPPAISNGGPTWMAGDPAPIGTTVTYTCDSSYTMDGADTVVCKGDGSWTAPPSCEAKPLLSNTQIIIIEGAVGGGIIIFLLFVLSCICCCVCRYRIRQRQYVEDEEALAHSGAFTLSNPLVGVKDEDAAGNPLYLTPDELTEFEQQH